VILKHEQRTLVEAIAICRVGQSFWGPFRRWKVIVDSRTGERTLACDCIQVMQVLANASKVGSLVYEIAHDFKTGMGCGVSSLISFTKILCEEAHTLLGTGDVSASDISHGFQLASQVCVDTLSDPSINSFCGMVSATDINVKLVRHGHRKNVAETAFQVSKLLQRCNSDDFGAVMLHSFPVPPFNRCQASDGSICLIDGVILPIQLHSWIRKLTNKKSSYSVFKVGLLKNNIGCDVFTRGGALSEKFQEVSILGTVGLLETSKLDPVEMIVGKIYKTGLNLVVVSGSVHENIQRVCAQKYDILVVEWAHMRELEALSRHFMISIYTDFSQLLEDAEVNTAVSHTFTEMIALDRASNKCLLRIQTSLKRPNNTFQLDPITVLVTSGIESTLTEIETSFWSCLHRLFYMSQIKMMVVGAGSCEKLLAKQVLEQIQAGQSRSSQVEIAMRSFASALLKIGDEASNFGLIDSTVDTIVYDDIKSKRGWLAQAPTVLHRLLHLSS